MQTHTKLRVLATALGALLFAAGYALHRQEDRGGDMLDAVAAVQRQMPMFLIGEKSPPRAAWLHEGGIYLSRARLSYEEVEGLPRDPRHRDGRWDGVVFFKARTVLPNGGLPLVDIWEGQCLDYGDFGVYGDPALLHQVQEILTREGFKATEARQRAGY
jgi:hypothetical protein